MQTEALERLAQAAHQGTSFVPERRAAQEMEAVREHLASVKATLEEIAKSDTARAVAAEEYAQYVERYTKRAGALLAAKGRCLSTMITGGSNFPVRRANKAGDVAHKRLTELLDFQRRAMSAMRRRIAKVDAPEPGDALAQKIARGERFQATAKAANKIVRKKGLSDDEKVARMIHELDLSLAAATEILKPDFCGRVGFPAYALTNNNANLKRWRARLAEMSPANTECNPIPFEGGVIEESPEDDRLRIFFDDKPAEDVRAVVKRHGFRWAPSVGAWQRQLTGNARASARALVEALTT